MTDLLSRPTSSADAEQALAERALAERALAERLLTADAPQRPQSTPVIRIEVDGQVVEGREGQTILEVCRDNGIEIPTLC